MSSASPEGNSAGGTPPGASGVFEPEQRPPAGSRHRVWCFGADVDTDQLAPGAYMKLPIEGIAPHCLEEVRPDFAPSVRAGDVLAAGPNFGIGSSREQAAAALLHLGVRAVIAPSFSGLFFRNAFNLGLLLLTCREAETLNEGETVWLDLQQMQVCTQDGRRLACEPIPAFLIDMVEAGGLKNQLRQRLQSRGGSPVQP